MKEHKNILIDKITNGYYVHVSMTSEYPFAAYGVQYIQKNLSLTNF